MRKARLGLALIGACLFASILGWSRTVPVAHHSPFLIDVWETEDGLPENSATSILQMPDGIWIGTFAGLARFDGVQFATYDRSNTPELPGVEIVSMFLDSAGGRWLSTEKGLARVDKSFQWLRFGPDQGWTGDYARAFVEKESGQLLVTSFNGRIFQFNGRVFKEMPRPDSELLRSSPARSFACYYDESGRLWAANDWYYGRWDGSQWVAVDGEPWKTWADCAITAPSLRHGLWVLAGGTNLFHYREGALTRRLALTHPIYDLWQLREEPDGTLFGASYVDGLSIISPSGQVVRYTTTNGLSSNCLRFTYRDHEQNLWIGSSGGGLMRFKNRNAVTYGRESGLPEPVTKTVTELRPGVLVIGTHGKGPLLLENGRMSPLIPDHGPRTPIYILSAIVDDTGGVWLGRLDEGAAWIKDGHEVPLPTNAVPRSTVYALLKDTRGRIWIGGDRHISVKDQDRFTLFGADQGLPPKSFRVLAEAPASQAIYAGAQDGGIYRYVEQGGTGHWLPLPGTMNQPIWSLHADSRGTLWAGTFGEGLLRIEEGKVSVIGEREGLLARVITAVLDDGLGSLWLGSNRGILRVRTRELAEVANGTRNRIECLQFGLDDGLASIECSGGSQPSALRDTAGNLWFATLKGVVAIDPKRLHLNDAALQTHIESVVVNDIPMQERRSLSQARAPQPGPHVLPAGTERIEIGYAAPSFIAPNKVTFRVRVQGLDADWRDVGTRRMIVITHPRPGPGRLMVQARNHHGTWSGPPAEFAFTITPHLWQQAWFKAVGVAGLVAIGSATATGIGTVRRRREREREAMQRRNDALERESEALRQAKEAAEAGDRAKSAFLATISHETRTPLNAVLGFAQLLLRDPTLSPQQQGRVGTIIRSGEHLLRILDDILQMVRLESKRLSITPALCNLHALLGEVDRTVRPHAQARNQSFSIEGLEALPVAVVIDATKLRQVLINLLDNASKYTPANGSIICRLQTAELSDGQSRLQVEVQDTGIGIAAEEQPLLFKPFSRVGADLARTGGTGLGLAISREYVQLMGGQLTVSSHLGSGSTFRFEIRLVRAENEVPPPASKPVPRVLHLQPGQPPCRVLAADDEPDNRELFEQLLTPLGFQVSTAADGARAVTQCATWTPHVVLLDLRMPVMDGYEAARRIRAAHGPAIKILAISAGVMPEQQQQALAAGADLFLGKPFESHELLERIRQLARLEYIYASDPTEAPQSTPSAETASAVARLPAALVENLRDALARADYDTLLTLTDGIAEDDQALAQRLHQMVEHFDYAGVERLLDASTAR